MVVTSLKTGPQLFEFPPSLLPNPIAWENYVHAIRYFPFAKYLGNTCIITFSSMFGQVLASSIVAYAFAKLRWPGRDVWFVVMISGMMLPDTVRIVPTYILFQHLGWVNTFLPLIVPRFLSNPLFTFLVRQYYMTLPNELSEAAMLDGCSHFGIYSKIILPLSKPVLTAVALFSFTFEWNDFLRPLVFLNDSDLFTLSLGLLQFRSEHMTYLHWLMAASVVVILPVLFVFFIGQKYFIEGVTMTGVSK